MRAGAGSCVFVFAFTPKPCSSRVARVRYFTPCVSFILSLRRVPPFSPLAHHSLSPLSRSHNQNSGRVCLQNLYPVILIRNVCTENNHHRNRHIATARGIRGVVTLAEPWRMEDIRCFLLSQDGNKVFG